MCGLFALSAKTKNVEKLLPRVKVPEDLKQRLAIAPTQDIAVVLNDGNNDVTFVKWGLIPFWSKDASIGKKMFNARAETLMEKPSFKNPFKYKRCIIIADAFYEWEKQEATSKKIRHTIKMKSGEPFALAGLWDTWTDKTTGETLTTATIITTVPNELIEEIHDRMPVIIPPDKIDLWLENGGDNIKELLCLLKPYPSEEMEITN